MAGDSQHNKNLFNIMVIGTAISFGVLGAIAFSMKDFFHGDATFNFSYKTLIGFVLGFVVGWVFWRVVRSKIEK
jgi:NhaP-type Na+/H+ or K+/H+ antiporter